jgi:hypothetical protein
LEILEEEEQAGLSCAKLRLSWAEFIPDLASIEVI